MSSPAFAIRFSTGNVVGQWPSFEEAVAEVSGWDDADDFGVWWTRSGESPDTERHVGITALRRIREEEAAVARDSDSEQLPPAA